MTDSEFELAMSKLRGRQMSDAEREQQIRSFAWGNAHFENPDVTREMIEQAVARLSSHSAK